VTRVGIIGAGGMGRTHARHYSMMEDVALVIFDIDRGAADALQTQARNASVATSLERLLANVDVVDVCLPTHLHKEIVLTTLNAKLPTLCEKPLARTVAECAQMVDAAHRHGTILMPAQVVRFFPEFEAANRLVSSGRLGTISAIRTRRGGGQPKGAGDWFRNPDLSGGVLLDLAVHDFDWILWTFGPVVRVFSQALTWSNVGSLDYALTTLTLESGALAHVEATWADPGGFRVTFEVAGSGGLIEFDSRQRATLRTAWADGARSEANLAPSDDPYFKQLRAFLRAAQGEVPPPVTAEEGMAAVAIAEAAIQSARTGKPVAPARFEPASPTGASES
jgi:predicted dehydrogenase